MCAGTGRPSPFPSSVAGILPDVSASAIVVLIAAVIVCLAAVTSLVAAVVLVGAARRLERGVEDLRSETIPLVSGARQAMDHATTELSRVEAVLEDTEAVTTRVDSASRLAQQLFSHPVVKILAWRAGIGTGLRRLGDPSAPGSRGGEAPVTLTTRSTRRKSPRTADRRDQMRSVG